MAKKPNDQLVGHEDLLETVLLEKGGVQYRLSVTEFRDVKYLSIREWYMSFEEEWAPTNNGFTVPYTLSTVSMLFNSLTLLLSEAETLDMIIRHTNEPETIPDTSE